MTESIRTPDENFAGLTDFPFEPHYHLWQDLRMHYLDEGPKDGPVMLLMHGMPTWSFLYRNVIPTLVEAGFRCITPDHMGFGRSDKPTDIHWYSIPRHTEILTSLICQLDLQNITLVCQDWGGPIGLAQAVYMPERFDRLVIMNTWLHHDEFEYSDAVRNWNASWHEGGRFHQQQPDIALLLVLSAGLAGPEVIFPALAESRSPVFSGEAATVYQGFGAPFRNLPDDAYNGLRRFPLSLPFDNPHQANAAAQSHHYQTLLNWTKPVHFIWGCQDDVFNEAWGRKWAEQMQASFDPIEQAGHFLQNTHGKEIAEMILSHL